jgi:hypothetical protein
VVVIQALIAALARSAGRILNTALAWATVMIFGKVPDDRQIYLSVLTFASLGWIAVVLGIVVPSVGMFLLSFVTLPDWVDRTWVRLAMLIAALVLPGVVGAVALLLKDSEERPRGAARVKAILKGYPFTLGLAVTLVLMTVFAPILKLQTIGRRWTSQHVPMLVESEHYDAVVEHVQRALATAGWKTERHPASWMLRLPTRVLTWLAGGSIDTLVAERLATLRSAVIEVVLHPSDLVVSGRAADVARARGVLARELAFSDAHLTWTKEANQLEDRLRAVWRELDRPRPIGTWTARSAHRLREIEGDLDRLEVSYEEWEVLFRAKLLVHVAMGCQTGLPGETTGRNGGWLELTLMPLGAALVRQTLASPRVRDRFERLVARWLDHARRREEERPERSGDRHSREAARAQRRPARDVNPTTPPAG